MQKINVIIADDHPIVLLGLRKLVEVNQHFIVVGEASDSNHLINLLEQHTTDVVLTDYSMPGDSPYGDGLKMIEYIIRHYPHVKVLVLTMISNSLTLTRLNELGVFGVIQKSQMRHEIEQALLAITRCKAYQNPITHIGDNNTSAIPIDERIARLTPREIETLRLFVSGNNVSDIARIQNRSAKTISAQKISAMRKLEVKSDQDLVLYCSDNSIFT